MTRSQAADLHAYRARRLAASMRVSCPLSDRVHRGLLGMADRWDGIGARWHRHESKARWHRYESNARA